MRLAVVTTAESWYFSDLRRAAADRHELTAINFRDLNSSIESDRVRVAAKGGQDLCEFDAILVRTMPPGSLEQVVFRMDVLAQLQSLGVVVMNSPRAIEVAVDKYLAAARLSAAGLLTPQTITCQTVDSALQAFDLLGRDVVVKPIFGSEGRGVARLTDESLAERAFRMIVQLGGVLYLQEFIPHPGFDIRVLVIGQRMFAMRRVNSLDWRTNVSRGAVAERIELTDELANAARRSADAVGANIAGVDLLPGKDGRLYAIEVNAVPGWKALAAALDVDIAQVVLDYLEMLVLES